MFKLASIALAAFWAGMGQPQPTTLDITYLVVGSQHCHIVGFTPGKLNYAVDAFVEKNGYATRATLAKTTLFRKRMVETKAHFIQDPENACEITRDSYSRMFSDEA